MSDNIVGKDHLDYVKDQITTRQEILGKSNRTSEDVTWMSGRNSWTKLMSSINIKDEDIVILNENNDSELVSNNGVELRNEFLGTEGLSGNTLARENILHAGTKNKTNLRSGVAEILSESSDTLVNYGFAAEDGQRGLLPMPGITSFSLKTYNKGSLRKATLGITAHNSQQFKYIETLYLRLGYTMLLEWGNTIFPLKNEDGSIRYSDKNDLGSLTLQNEFLNYGWDKGANYFYTRIEDLREDSQGNYDAFLGRVENFSWEFTKNGSYNITLDLITIGSVVESLTINTNLDSIFYVDPPNAPQNDVSDDERPSALETAIDLLTNTLIDYREDWNVQWLYTYEYAPSTTTLTKTQEKCLGLSSFEFNPNNYAFAINASYGEGGNNKNSDAAINIPYMRFGSLLRFINQKLLLYDRNLNPTHIEIDTSIDSYCYSNGWSFSGDPTKMVNQLIFDYDLWSTPGSNYWGGKDVEAFPKAEKFHDTLPSGEKVGRIMNLYFSKDYLVEVIESNSDEEGNLTLFTFIKSLLDTANNLLGGVNKLNLRITDKTFDVLNDNGDLIGLGIKQVLEIYDEVRVKKIDTNPVFNVFGFDPNDSKVITTTSTNEDGEEITTQSNLKYNGGSFITSLDLKTSISKELSTQISIGSQANGSTVGEDVTLFSKWNVGLVDRVIPSKLNIDSAKRQVISDYLDFIKLRNRYLSYLKFLYNSSIKKTSQKESYTLTTIWVEAYTFPNVFLKSTDPKYPSFQKFEKVQKDFFKRMLAFDASRKNIANPFIGFLPVKVTLEMDGLSGIRIFDKLTLDSRFLPSNYTDTLDFIITELDHKFDKNKWVTTVGTLSMPKLFSEVSEIDIDDIIEQVELKNSEEDRVNENSALIPSYFVLNNKRLTGLNDTTGYWSADYLTEGSHFTTFTPEKVKDLESEVLAYYNPSVRDDFRQFLNGLLNLHPTGYEFRINSVVRSLADSLRVGSSLTSLHNWGLSIDLSIYEAGSIDGTPKLLYGNGEEHFQYWKDLEIEKLAKSIGLRWGGTFTGQWDYDNVHFDAFNLVNWSKLKTPAVKALKKTFPGISDLIEVNPPKLKPPKPGDYDTRIALDSFTLSGNNWEFEEIKIGDKVVDYKVTINLDNINWDGSAPFTKGGWKGGTHYRDILLGD